MQLKYLQTLPLFSFLHTDRGKYTSQTSVRLFSIKELRKIHPFKEVKVQKVPNLTEIYMYAYTVIFKKLVLSELNFFYSHTATSFPCYIAKNKATHGRLNLGFKQLIPYIFIHEECFISTF